MICKMNFLILRNVVVNFHFHFDEKINYDCVFISLFIYQIISTSPQISISYSLFISSIIISSITQLNSFVLILYQYLYSKLDFYHDQFYFQDYYHYILIYRRIVCTVFILIQIFVSILHCLLSFLYFIVIILVVISVFLAFLVLLVDVQYIIIFIYLGYEVISHLMNNKYCFYDILLVEVEQRSFHSYD